MLQRPFIASVRMTMAMRGKKAAAMLPEPRPDAFAVRSRKLQSSQRVAREKLKSPFAMGGRERSQSPFQLKQKHQPMALSPVTVLADNAGQMQLQRVDRQAEF